MPPGMVATGPVIPPAGRQAAPDDEEQAMRRSDDQPGSRPRRGRRLAAAAQIPASVSALRTEFAAWTSNASLPIMITETNSVSSNPAQRR